MPVADSESSDFFLLYSSLPVFHSFPINRVLFLRYLYGLSIVYPARRVCTNTRIDV